MQEQRELVALPGELRRRRTRPADRRYSVGGARHAHARERARGELNERSGVSLLARRLAGDRVGTVSLSGLRTKAVTDRSLRERARDDPLSRRTARAENHDVHACPPGRRLPYATPRWHAPAIRQVTMDRRSFVHSFAASLVGASALRRSGSPSSRSTALVSSCTPFESRCGRIPKRTLAAVRAIGYTDVELLWSFGNFGRTPQQVRRVARPRRTSRSVGAHRAGDPAQGLGQESRRRQAARPRIPDRPQVFRRRRTTRSSNGGSGRIDSTWPGRRRGERGSGSHSTMNPITSSRSTARFR